MTQHQHNNGSRGFTLIELLVVMGIIGILATLMFTNFSGVRSRARDAQRKSDLAQMKNALRLYYNDYQSYPGAGLDQSIHGCGASHTDGCEWGESFTSPTTVYMNQLPQDPLYDATNSPTTIYRYQSVSSNTFSITASLENESDSAIQKSQAACNFSPTDSTTYVVCAD